MATWAVGDVQGCLRPLRALLDKIRFDPGVDDLWLVGDLVGRGPDPLGVLDLIMSMGHHATCVLGNHDLNLLAIDAGITSERADDNLGCVLRHPDRARYVEFLSKQPLAVYSERLDTFMSHAGLYPLWDVAQAISLSDEVHSEMAFGHRTGLLKDMYGNRPAQWSDHLNKPDRLRFSINAFTRMRFCDPQGALEFSIKQGPGSAPEPWRPWYEIPNPKRGSTRVVFGHWSTAGLVHQDNVIGLDSGCVWGRSLSAVQLEPEHANIVSVPCHTLKT